MDVSDGSPSLGQLIEEASSVVVATAASVESLGRPASAEDPRADEYVGVSLRVDEMVRGEAIDVVALVWDANQVDPDGRTVATIISNGLRPPQVGDQMLLFIRPADPVWKEHMSGFPTHSPVALDGVAYVSDGRVETVETGSSFGAEVVGRHLNDVIELIRATQPSES